jgi:tetratricopeptide (TPR) repeat protein
MRKEFVAAILVLAAVPAAAQNAVRSVGNYQHGVVANAGSGSDQPENDYANGRRLMHFEKYAEAIPFLRSAHLQQPHNADILALLGYAYHMTGDNDLALAFYQAALQENPDHLQAHEYLGELYLDKHFLQSAQEQLAQLTRLCASGCDERDALTKSIATYQASASATPATPPKNSN